MAFSIAVSMLVSFSLTPRWRRAGFRPHIMGEKSFGERMVDRFYRPIENVYARVLGFVMRRRWVVVVMSLVTLGSCVPLGAAAPKGSCR